MCIRDRFGPGAGLGMHEWMMVALWTVIGIILYIITKGKFKNVPEGEREMLIFGEDYAREEYLDR